MGLTCGMPTGNLLVFDRSSGLLNHLSPLLFWDVVGHCGKWFAVCGGFGVSIVISVVSGDAVRYDNGDVCSCLGEKRSVTP